MARQPVVEVLAGWASAGPDRPAVSCQGRTVTRRELEARSNSLARAYADLGVRQGDLVTVALPNSIEFYEACCAIWKLGATPQPVSWRLPERERAQIIELADAPLVVGVDGPVPGRSTVPVGFEPDRGFSDAPLPTRVAPSWRAMTTGGSTGRPKLVLNRDPATFDPGVPPLAMRPEQVTMVAGPLYHSAPFTSMFGLFLGHHIVVLPRFDAVVALETIERDRVNYTRLVPTMMLRMWRVLEPDPGRYDLRSLQTVWHMGAPCPVWLKQVWIDLVGPDTLLEAYASTESLGSVQISGAEWLEHRGSVGRPVNGELMIVDEAGRPVPAGTVGEIYMRRGSEGDPPYRYVGAESRTLPGGWHSVGDMGSVDDDGFLYIADRRTDMIVAGGANVYPAEVEGVILEHPDVLSCAVVGLPDEDLGQRVHAVVQRGPSATVDETALRDFVAERLVRYKVPRSFHFADESLRDDAGKVRRGALRDAEIARIARDVETIRPAVD
jgi:bile acid-coenzyme A ligase